MKWFIIQETIFTQYSSILYQKLILLFFSAPNVCNIRIIENIIDTTPPWHINTKYQNIRVSVCFNGIALTHVAVNLTLVLYSSSSPFRQDGLHCEFLFNKKLFVLYWIMKLRSMLDISHVIYRYLSFAIIIFGASMMSHEVRVLYKWFWFFKEWFDSKVKNDL